MQLNIDLETPIFFRHIDRQLNISSKRVEELFTSMEDIFNELATKSKLDENGGSMGAAYKKICALCNNIEEYTLCMHAFIFRSARSGHLKSEVEAN